MRKPLADKLVCKLALHGVPFPDFKKEVPSYKYTVLRSKQARSEALGWRWKLEVVKHNGKVLAVFGSCEPAGAILRADRLSHYERPVAPGIEVWPNSNGQLMVLPQQGFEWLAGWVNPAMKSAFLEGAAHALLGLPRETCPYDAYVVSGCNITWRRAFATAWFQGYNVVMLYREHTKRQQSLLLKRRN